MGFLRAASGLRGAAGLARRSFPLSRVVLGRVLHTEEKLIKRSGLPAAGGACLSTAAMAAQVTVSTPSPGLVEDVFNVNVVESVPCLLLRNSSRRLDATVFLSQVFRSLAPLEIGLGKVSTSVSNVAVALTAPLTESKFDAIKACLEPLDVACSYDEDFAMIHCSASPLVTKADFERETFRIFSDHGLHSHMFAGVDEVNSISAIVPKNELKMALERIVEANERAKQ